MKNIFQIKQTSKEEIFTKLLDSNNTRLEHIVSYGQSSQQDFWYNQEENEWVVVLDGFARLEFEDKTVELKKGEFINILAHQKHRVVYTQNPTIWLAVFYK
ncbi:MAG: hypothetical protein RL154_1684 [Pseudomonadota bacterium]|jgi:cupin 2 domain-containing protein